MKYFEEKNIHSSCSTWSTNDIAVVREISRSEFMAHADARKLVSRKRGFSIAHAPADKKFYHLPFGQHANEDELRQHAEVAYLSRGWTDIKQHMFLKEAISGYCEDERIADKARRTKQGYVIPEWTREMPPDDYQGGFSDTVFKHPANYDYVKAGGCHGFIGHSVRKPALDAYFERQFLKVNSDKGLLAMWLTSTGGRHFGDSLESSAFAEQKKYIRENIADVIAQANRYAADNLARKSA